MASLQDADADPGKTATHPAFFAFGFPGNCKHELVTSQTQTGNFPDPQTSRGNFSVPTSYITNSIGSYVVFIFNRFICKGSFSQVPKPQPVIFETQPSHVYVFHNFPEPQTLTGNF